MIFKLTKHRSVAAQKKVHALQGGGPGLQGLYIRDLAWCGVEKRAGVYLVETDAEPTCRTCLRLIQAHENKKKGETAK